MMNLYLSLIFKYAQKIHKLNKRKHLLESNLKHFSNRNGKNNYDLQVNLYKTALEIIDKQISARKNEINEMLFEVKNLYEKQEIDGAKIFLDLINSEIKHSGLEFSQEKMNDLEKKISTCMEISQDLANFDSFLFTQKPPVKIQLAYIRVMEILNNSKENLDKNDSIHQNLIQKSQNVYDKFQNFMKKNEIAQNQKYLSRFSIFYILIDNILLNIHGLRLKFLLYCSKTSKSLQISKNFLSKAQKLIQKKPSFFSADQKSITLNRIKKITLKREELIDKSENIIISTSSLMNSYKFGDAEIQLNFLLDELKGTNLPLIIEKVEIQLELCKINKEIGNKIMDIESILSNQDILGAKSAIVELKNSPNLILNKEKIIPAINMRIQKIESNLSKNNTDYIQTSKKAMIGKTSKSPKKDENMVLFNQFKDIILRENEIEKKEIAKLLKISEDELFESMLIWKEKVPFELENGIVILKTQLHKKQNTDSIKRKSKKSGKKTRKKEEDSVLEDLDELMNTDFNKKK